MDEPAQQLNHELLGSVRRAFKCRRPILTHLNADTTWLIQLPYPKDATPPRRRSRYNILIDPWLSGPQSDVAGWFSTQWHAIPSSVQSIKELDGRLREIEEMAQASDTSSTEPATYIDAVAISHEFTDHLHKATLLELDPSVPVFATDKAAALVRSWNHFQAVYLSSPFPPDDADWRKTSTGPLPHWIGISRVTSPGNALYYHSAIMIAFDAEKGEDAGLLHDADTAEVIIYSPHGIVADDLSHLPKAVPPIKTLALLHGLHDVGITLTKQLNLGAHNGLKVQRICEAKYWVGTHDEVKTAGGILAPFLRRERLTVKEALEKEAAETDFISDPREQAGLRDVRFSDLKSGESLLLL